MANDDGLHKIPVMREALLAIRELHKPKLIENLFSDFRGSTADRWYRVCATCDIDTYPCPTRVLADQALGGEERG